MELQIKERISSGLYTNVFATSNEKMVFLSSEDFFKYDFISTYEKVHQVQFQLSEKNVINNKGNNEDISFFMKRLYQRQLTEEESVEVKWLENLSKGSMFYDDMETYVRQNAKTKIGQAFADTMLAVLEFYNTFNHGYSMLDFHQDQILFDEKDNCYILDILE